MTLLKIFHAGKAVFRRAVNLKVALATICALFLSLYSNSQNGQKQQIDIGLRLGVNASELTGDGHIGFRKRGFVCGLAGKIRLQQKWSVALNLLYVEKGARHPGDPAQRYYGSYYVKFYYFELPVLFIYTHNNLSFNFGPGIGYAIRQRELNYQGQNIFDGFSDKEVSFNLGLQYKLNEYYYVDFRYTNSVIALRPNPSGTNHWYDPGQQNRVIALAMTYHFHNRSNTKGR